METRMIAACAIVVACTLAGKTLCDAKCRRTRALGELIAGLEQMRVGILGLYEPVADCLQRSECALLRRVADAMRGGDSAEQAWENLLRAKKEDNPARPFDEGDILLLRRLFSQLGASETHSQELLLSGTIEVLRERLAAAKAEDERARRLYLPLSLLTGILLALIVV